MSRSLSVKGGLALLSALWLAGLPTVRGRNFVTTFVGYLLCLLLLQISAQWFAVLRVWWKPRAQGRLLAVAVSAAALGVGAAVYSVGGLSSLSAMLPTRPFVEVVSAQTTTAGLLWALLCVGMLVALVASLCTIDGEVFRHRDFTPPQSCLS